MATAAEVQKPESITQWWMRTAEVDLAEFLPKLQEYGAHDLEEHGRIVALFAEHSDLDYNSWGELGCIIYLHGKLARALEAYQHGRLPSNDTLKDIAVYAQMARAYRERGGLK